MEHDRPTIASLRARLKPLLDHGGASGRDLDLLLRDAFDASLAWLVAHDDELVDEATVEAIEVAVERRLDGEPLQYIRRRCEFYGREYYVDDRVLIPRPETEILVELALERVNHGTRVIDIGTGSGAIAISIAAEAPGARVAGSDRSVSALAVAVKNQRILGTHVQWIAGDVLDCFGDGLFDMIVTNPPYVAERDVATLQREVRDHEPLIALSPGGDGFGIIRKIFAQAIDRLAPDGSVLMEIGFLQHEAVEEIARINGFSSVSFAEDLAGIPRIVHARR